MHLKLVDIQLVTAVVKMPLSNKRSRAAKKRCAAPEDHASTGEVKLPDEKKAKPSGVGQPPYPKAKQTLPNSTNKQTVTNSENQPTIPNSTNQQTVTNSEKQTITNSNNQKLCATCFCNEMSDSVSVHLCQTDKLTPTNSMPTTVGNSVNKHPVTDDGFSLTKPVTFPERSVLMGSFHQGHPQFGDEQNKQCGAISLTAVLKSKTKSVLTWNTRDLDDVLVKGTFLYRSMRAQGKVRDYVRGRGYIAVSELPTRQIVEL
ncbi:uncharacterized protein LOC134014026 isoform X2 [Osmerus eperlanus]|uniref:uncharacterized protein LOC134014026 isoform X2 n=1 Tax=Osmerus eperlanus TaxID=29151 RepID=UPI002E0EBD93